jgi:hypothetical protein
MQKNLKALAGSAKGATDLQKCIISLSFRKLLWRRAAI